MIRVLIADDEPLSRAELNRCLTGSADLEVVGEARDGLETVELVLSERPDLVFLDVQMPGCDGFEVVARVREVHLPQVVFVTAFDRYAVSAFDAHAVDYLLKPFTDERFSTALGRARRLLAKPDPEQLERTLALLRATAPASPREPHLERLSVAEKGGWRLVRTQDVDWFESAGNYVEVHAGAVTHIVRMTMGHLEQVLDPRQFTRIHRTVIVNLDRVSSVRPGPGEGYEVLLTNGQILKMSQRFRGRLLP